MKIDRIFLIIFVLSINIACKWIKWEKLHLYYTNHIAGLSKISKIEVLGID